MKTLTVVGMAPILTNDREPQTRGISFQVQDRNKYGYLQAEFTVMDQQYHEWVASGQSLEELAQDLLSEILELNRTPVDAFILEDIQRKANDASTSANQAKENARDEASKVAIEEVTKAVETVVEDVKLQATEVVTKAKEEVVTEAVASAKAETEMLKSVIRKLVRIDELPDEEINDLIDLYPVWEIDELVKVGEIRNFEGQLYKVIQEHTTQAEWTPPQTPSLWNTISPPTTEEGEDIIPEWVQPTGAHDAYKTGDKVIFEGQVYESLIDANTWSPSDYPQGWREVTE